MLVKQKYVNPKMLLFHPFPISPPGESILGAVFVKHIQCMLFDDTDPNDPQFTGITKGCSEKELWVFLLFPGGKLQNSLCF